MFRDIFSTNSCCYSAGHNNCINGKYHYTSFLVMFARGSLFLDSCGRFGPNWINFTCLGLSIPLSVWITQSNMEKSHLSWSVISLWHEKTKVLAMFPKLHGLSRCKSWFPKLHDKYMTRSQQIHQKLFVLRLKTHNI